MCYFGWRMHVGSAIKVTAMNPVKLVNNWYLNNRMLQ